MDNLKKHLPKIVTITLVVVALAFAYALHRRRTTRPWTRDGQVRADVVQIAPRVSGYLDQVAVKDNQPVRKGELLFRIDRSSYQLAVDQAQVELDQAREDVAGLEAAVRAAEATVKQRNAAVDFVPEPNRGGPGRCPIGRRRGQRGRVRRGVRPSVDCSIQSPARRGPEREAERAKRLADAKGRIGGDCRIEGRGRRSVAGATGRRPRGTPAVSGGARQGEGGSGRSASQAGYGTEWPGGSAGRRGHRRRGSRSGQGQSGRVR